MIFEIFTGRKRLNRICRQFYESGRLPEEKRGGTRQTAMQKCAKESVRDFIGKLRPTEGHYNRKKSSRRYLSPLLTIRQLYSAWSSQFVKDNPGNVPCKYQTFYDIFVKEFNISFKTPRTDVCSTCARYENQKMDPKHVQEAELALKLHKLRARQFGLIRAEDAKTRRTMVLCFDLQQNIPLPRTNIGEVFYKRQLWMYNLGVVHITKHQDNRTVFLYNWLESDSGRGSNEVISAVLDFLRVNLTRIKKKRYRCLSLFADSCPGQNKNYTMLFALLTYINSPLCPFRTIKFTFPVRGHSYMEADQVFGRIEKDMRKRETVLLPSTYQDIMQQHGTVKRFNDDWRAYDFKKLVKLYLSTAHVQLQNSKRWF